MASPSYRLGVDVGGTFTDLLLLREDTGDTWRAKVPSTPEDQSLAVIHGKDQILKNIPSGADIVLHVVNHGTTVATNAILEQKGAKVALVVTEGYKDILQTRRSQVPGGLASWIIWPKPEVRVFRAFSSYMYISIGYLRRVTGAISNKDMSYTLHWKG